MAGKITLPGRLVDLYQKSTYVALRVYIPGSRVESLKARRRHVIYAPGNGAIAADVGITGDQELFFIASKTYIQRDLMYGA